MPRQQQRATANPSMREAMRRAATKDGAAARDLAYSLAKRQRDAQRAPARTSPGYADYIESRRGAKR